MPVYTLPDLPYDYGVAARFEALRPEGLRIAGKYQ
jgi:hypothetical protein